MPPRLVALIFVLLLSKEGKVDAESKSRMIPEFGVKFEEEGVAILDANFYDLMLKIDLKALNWTIPQIDPNDVFDCRHQHPDLEALCARLQEMHDEHVKMHNQNVNRSNEYIRNEIGPRIAGKAWIKLNSLMEEPSEVNWDGVKERFHEHLESLVDGELQVVTEKIAWNFITGDGQGAQYSYLWNGVLKNGNSEFAQRYAAGAQKSLAFDWTCADLESLDREYFNMWKTVYLTTENRFGMMALSSQRVLSSLSGFQREVDLARDKYREMYQVVEPYLGARRGAVRRVDMRRIMADRKRNIYNQKWNPLKTQLIKVYNQFTRKAVRELLTLAVSLSEHETAQEINSVKQWLVDLERWWGTADMTKRLTQQSNPLPPWQVNHEKKLRRISREKRQIGIAIGLGVASMIASAAGTTATQFKMGSMSERMRSLERKQKQGEGEIKMMQGNYITLAESTLETCESLQDRIGQNRREIDKIMQLMGMARSWEQHAEEEILKLHEMIVYTTDITSLLISRIHQDQQMLEQYFQELREFAQALDHLEQGKLDTFWVKPAKLAEMLSAVTTNIAQQGGIYELVMKQTMDYYKLPVQYDWEHGVVVIKISVPIRRAINPVHTVLRVTSVSVPYDPREEESKLETKLEVRKPFFLAAPVNYAIMSEEEMNQCVKVGKLWICDEIIVQHRTAETMCFSALYEKLHLDIIKQKCNFLAHPRSARPMVLESADQVILSGFGENWKFQCDDPQSMPKTTIGKNYATIDANFLCECSITGNGFEVPSSKKHCTNRQRARMRLSQEENLAVLINFEALVQDVNDTVELWRQEMKKSLHTAEWQPHFPKIVNNPEGHNYFENEGKDLTASLKEVVNAAKTGQAFYTHSGAWTEAEIQTQKLRSFWTWIVRGALTLGVLIALVIICVYGKKIKSRLRNVQFATFWRNIADRQSFRERQDEAARIARNREAKKEIRRMRHARNLGNIEVETRL